MEYKWVVLTVTTIGLFMAVLDGSMVVVGLPSVIQDLHTSLSGGIWIITGYRLVNTIALLSIGRMADIFGRVKLYKIGFMIFIVGSALAAFAPSAELLIASRFVEGFGGALLIVNTIVIIADSFPSNQFGTAIGLSQMVVNMAQVTGFTLSGILITVFGWRSMFLLNVPIGIFATIWAHIKLKELPRKTGDRKFDWPGATIYSTGLALLLVSMTTGDVRSISTQLMLLTSLPIFAAFVFFERRVKSPVISMDLFKIKAFTMGNLSNLMNGVAFGALPFSMSLFFQVAKGYTPLQAGLALIPLNIAVIIVGPISGRLSDRFGQRWFSTLGLMVTGVAFSLLATMQIDTPYEFEALALAVAGLGVGTFRSPNASLVMGSVPPERRGIASGVRSTIMNAAVATSIPLATLLMSIVIPYASLSLLMGGRSPSRAELDLFLGGLRVTFLAFAAIGFLAAAVSLLWKSASITAAASQDRAEKSPGRGKEATSSD